jgi:hypothetical protein
MSGQFAELEGDKRCNPMKSIGCGTSWRTHEKAAVSHEADNERLGSNASTWQFN